MIDLSKVLRDFLVTALGATAKIYAETDTPPAGYKPSDGVAYCFKLRSGQPDYADGVYSAPFGFKVYAATTLEAQTAYRALVDALHNAGGAKMRWAQNELLGLSFTEPETAWPFVFTIFRVWVIDR